MVDARDGAVRELLSQMVKDGQAKNLGRGSYVHPDYQNSPDNADKLTKTNRDGEGLSGSQDCQGSSVGVPGECHHGVRGGCWLCQQKHTGEGRHERLRY